MPADVASLDVGLVKECKAEVLSLQEWKKWGYWHTNDKETARKRDD